MKQSATIFTNDPQNERVQIRVVGLVKPYIIIEPHFRIYLKGFAGEEVEQIVTITSAEEEPLEIKEITSTVDDKITYEIKTVEKGKSYNIAIKSRSGMKESFQGKILVKTNSKKKPELELFVTGKLLNEVQVSPSYIYFGIIDRSKKDIDPQSLKRTAEIKRLRKNGIAIEKVEIPKEWIKTKVESQGGIHTLTITLDKDKLPQGEFREQLTIITRYDNTSENAMLIIEGKVIEHRN